VAKKKLEPSSAQLEKRSERGSLETGQPVYSRRDPEGKTLPSLRRPPESSLKNEGIAPCKLGLGNTSTKKGGAPEKK